MDGAGANLPYFEGGHARVNKTDIHTPLDKWEQRGHWCTEVGSQSSFSSTFLHLVNNCISGSASPRKHLLQNWLFPGALITHLVVHEAELGQRLDWLSTCMMSQGSLDMLLLMGLPIAGYHEIGRDDTKADFTRKILKGVGFVEIYPMLISRFDDDQPPV